MFPFELVIYYSFLGLCSVEMLRRPLQHRELQLRLHLKTNINYSTMIICNLQYGNIYIVYIYSIYAVFSVFSSAFLPDVTWCQQQTSTSIQKIWFIQELGLCPVGCRLIGYYSGHDAGDLLFGHHCLQAGDGLFQWTDWWILWWTHMVAVFLWHGNDMGIFHILFSWLV